MFDRKVTLNNFKRFCKKLSAKEAVFLVNFTPEAL